MAAEFGICVYRPKAPDDGQFRRKLDKHLEVLDAGGYLASRRHLILESETDGAILELLEWKSSDAAGRAHDDPGVMAIWAELSEAADIIALKDLAEADRTFPHFRPYRE